MACGYCKTVVCDPCPVCGLNLTMTPRPIRKAKAPNSPHVARYVAPVVVSPTREEQIRQNEARIAALQMALGAAKAAPRPVPASYPAKAQPVAAVRARPGAFTVVTNADWEAAARFTRAVLRVPKQIESTCRVVGFNTMPPVSRGDWAGLARAVEAGILTEAQAIELAAGWRVGVAS